MKFVLKENKTKKINKKLKIEVHPEFINDLERLFSSKLKYLIPRKFDDWKYEIKWAWQRVFKGYDDRATWGFDSWVSEYAPKILRDMKSFVHGYPSNSFGKKKKGDIQSVKEWKGVIEKIAKGFDAANSIQNNEYMKKVKLKKPRKDMFGNDSYTDYKFDKKKHDKLMKNFDEGMKLFHKYYFNLWD